MITPFLNRILAILFLLICLACVFAPGIYCLLRARGWRLFRGSAKGLAYLAPPKDSGIIPSSIVSLEVRRRERLAKKGS